MLAGLVELNVRITFLCQAQVDHAGSDVSEVIAAIKRQLAFVTLELFQSLRVCTSTQRAVATLTDSYTASTLYSLFRRATTTSNCSTPTAPTIRSLLEIGRNTCTAPSSESCTSPLSSCFCFSGSSGGYDGTVLVRSWNTGELHHLTLEGRRSEWCRGCAGRGYRPDTLLQRANGHPP